MDLDLSKFKFEFNSSNGIMFKYYFGGITFQDVVSSWEYGITNNLIPKENKGFLVDYTKAKFTSPISEHHIIPEFYRKHSDIFGHHKIAVLTVNPKDIVVPILVKQKDYGYISRPFTTLEAAVNWILE